jgi:hypothetical protein
MKNTYHVGLVKGSGAVKFWGNNHRSKTVILQARRDKDFLSSDLWKYEGEHITTKKELKNNKFAILGWINKTYGANFTRIIID